MKCIQSLISVKKDNKTIVHNKTIVQNVRNYSDVLKNRHN